MKLYLFKTILGMMTGRKPVIILDHDGEEHTRLSYMKDGKLMAIRNGFSFSAVELLPDGTTRGVSYVKTWRYLA